jgi:RHS repeat-associated protein
VNHIFAGAGRERDPETGMSYNWHRYGDLRTHQWVSEDRVWDDVNSYRYVRNTPTSWIDPDGLTPIAPGGMINAWREIDMGWRTRFADELQAIVDNLTNERMANGSPITDDERFYRGLIAELRNPGYQLACNPRTGEKRWVYSRWRAIAEYYRIARKPKEQRERWERIWGERADINAIIEGGNPGLRSPPPWEDPIVIATPIPAVVHLALRVIDWWSTGPQKPEVPFPGFSEWGRSVVRWGGGRLGGGPADARKRASEITVADAQQLDPQKVELARRFYELVLKHNRANETARARIELLKRIQELQRCNPPKQ